MTVGTGGVFSSYLAPVGRAGELLLQGLAGVVRRAACKQFLILTILKCGLGTLHITSNVFMTGAHDL